MPTSAVFEKAAVDVKKLTKQPADDERLKLYGLFKIAHNTSFASAKQPGAFDFQAKYKYNAWKKMVDEGVTSTQAQQQYVKFVEELKPKYGFDPNKKPEGS
ncbi:hypothetical protein MMC26_002514 [Xylographa opegraphella]|nr:hypothetical protein [Xylographa opegraphella]